MIAAIVRKELAVTWSTWVPYVVAALFNGALGLLFIDQLQGRLQAIVQPLFPLAGFLLLITVPLLTMRAVAEEVRAGTLDVLLAIPVPAAALVAGKWIASWLTVIAVVAPSGAFAWLVSRYGDPDPGPIVAGFLGIVLLSAALTAAGIAASSLTSSQALAGMTSFVLAAMLWFASAATGVRAGASLARVSLSERLRGFAGGAIDSADAGFFVAVTVALLLIAMAGVTRRRA